MSCIEQTARACLNSASTSRLHKPVADDPVEADVGLGRADGKTPVQVRGHAHLGVARIVPVDNGSGRRLTARLYVGNDFGVRVCDAAECVGLGRIHARQARALCAATDKHFVFYSA